VPAGVANNKILLVHFYLEPTVTITGLPSGFTEVGSGISNSAHGQRVFWKRATGADSGTYTFTHGSTWTEAAATSYTGATLTGSPIDTTGTAQRGTSGTVTPPVSLTTTGSDRLIVWGGTVTFASGTGGWTPPSGYTERVDAALELSVATLAQPVAGSTGAITGTSAQPGPECGFLLALLPLSSSVPLSYISAYNSYH
jgi:hypothetical protein